MTVQHQVTIHTWQAGDVAAPGISRAVVESVVRPRDCPATSYPISLRSRSRSPSPRDWAALPEFRHWVPSPCKHKKRVRIESPVQTERTSAKELVPASPEDQQSTTAPELAIGAIQRCIPSNSNSSQPYHHLARHDSVRAPYPEPRKQSRVLVSFVDPSYAPSSKQQRSSTTTRALDDLSGLSPETAQFFLPGREGSWLIPVSGRLPLEAASPPTWHARPPPPPRRPDRSTTTSSSSSPPRSIEWTSARLKALWSYLTELHESSTFGPLRAACHLSPPPPPLHPPPISSSSSLESSLPEYVKVTISAPVALSFRTFLNWVSVKNAPRPSPSPLTKTNKTMSSMSTSSRKSDDDPEGDDAERWLYGTPLVWVDESGRAILVA